VTRPKFTRPELPPLTPAQVAEESRRTLQALHPDWTISPGPPWSATRYGVTVSAADVPALHDEIVRFSKGRR
jgi:hypothetical protein